MARVQALQELSDGQTRRKCFATHSGIQKNKPRPTFHVNFAETLKPIYEAMMSGHGFALTHNANLKKHYHFVDPDDIHFIEEWERAQGSRVFIRDTLSLSIALALMYTASSCNIQRTTVGELVYQAKYHGNTDAIQGLAGRLVETIRSLPYYRKAHYICAVPPSPNKISPDLPSHIASLVAKELEIEDITAGFHYQNAKSSLKSLPLVEKWPALEAAGISYTAGSLSDKKIILIDDLYQSGITMQFIAMKLQEAGAYHIYGLSMVKNLSDTDNQ